MVRLAEVSVRDLSSAWSGPRRSAGLVGTAASHVAGSFGWLGAAGTLPETRGRGAQSALLVARIRAAGSAGARVLAAEIERVDGEAGPSFGNVRRAGFEEAYDQQWWVRPE